MENQSSDSKPADSSLPDGRRQPPPSNIDLAQIPPPTPTSRLSGAIYSPLSEGIGHTSAASDISGDAVFPIRSVISVDPSNQAPTTIDSNNDRFRRSRRNTIASSGITGSTGTELRETASVTPKSTQRARQGGVSRIQADADRHGSAAPIELDIGVEDENDTEETGPISEPPGSGVGQIEIASPTANDITGHVATRFKHVETADGHSVITGRDGTLQRCEDEPIHTPGAVQAFGVLLAMQEDTDGRFVVRYVSENSERLLGYRPAQLFNLGNFLDILSEEQQDNLLDHIDFIRDEDADPVSNGPEILSLSIRHPKAVKSVKLWCAIHINPVHPNLIICEFELDDDQEFPLRPPDETILDAPVDTLDSNPTREEIEESTEMLSKPLRILRSARKRRGEQGAMQVFDIMSQVQEQLATAQTLDRFLKVLVGIVKELTGFHRVMIYQFDSSFNGKVVTELVDTVQTKDLYKGLNFPASDIPAQARELYKINKVRLLYDRDQETARIVCRTKEDLAIPLDMTHAYLRAMSPIHLKYLGHMGVRSSMSISIDAFNDLWGLISCHSYGGHGMRVSFPIRKMCRVVGETASRNIERLTYTARLEARKLINTSPTDKNPSGYIVASSDDLLTLFDADFGLLSISDETKILGRMQHSQEALALLEYLRMRKFTSVTASQDVKVDFRDLRYAPGFQGIAGLLYVPLSVTGNDFIVFFRKGQVEEVRWAGNPYEKQIREGTASYLEPRSSFKCWKELVMGKCRDWKEEQVETAAVLCIVYGKFIEIWRQKEAALENSKLTKLLLANSAHEVRTPLNAIINYLEIALEGHLDNETRENLAKSHSASKSLVYVINDLLDLTKAEEGQNLIADDVFQLSMCIKEATEPFQDDAKRKGIAYEVVIHPDLPDLVSGDGRRVRQAISNVAANAIAYTESGFVKIEVSPIDITPEYATLEFVFTDSGIGMDSNQIDGLFRDLEQVSAPNSDVNLGESQTLGLGLALVGRVVRTMDGQLRVKSERGRGSKFVIQLPFHLPQKEPSTSVEAPKEALAAIRPSAPRKQNSTGEVLLVTRSSAEIVRPAVRDASIGSGSRRSGSQGSQDSKRSDADRLIDAISTPLSRRESRTLRRTSLDNVSHGTTCEAPAEDIQPREEPQKAKTADEDDKSKLAANAPGTTKLVQEYQGTTSPAVKEPKLVELPAGARVSIGSDAGANNVKSLRVLIAEDDPVNMRILKTRLERAGHQVYETVNGQDCASFFESKSSEVDIVLMDMQMPIVDGLTSTKLIRELEAKPTISASPISKQCGRVPIFAVSASLEESKMAVYTTAGFDGWILKPVDFKRLSTLMTGAHQEETRKESAYIPGNWERGGWFCSNEPALDSET